MNKEQQYDLFQRALDEGEIYLDEPMKKHTSFKIGGPADFFIRPKTIEEIKKVLQICKEQNISYYLIGNGSNLLVRDKGYRGAIIQIYKNMNEAKIEGTTVYAQAGILLSRLSKMIFAESLTGFEFAHGIPGTLGGAVYMNAGAYGGEIKDVIQHATVLDQDGNVLKMTKEDLELGYRMSLVQKKGYIVLEACFEFSKGNYEEIKATIDDLTGKRTTKQPLELPSAGSTFKRPPGHFAGKLIMDAGLRGCRIGGAQVSEKHCGFVVNVGNATAADVLHLIAHVQKEVKQQFGIELEPEVRIIGEE